MAGHSLKLSNSPYPRNQYELVDKYKLRYINKIALQDPLERNISYTEIISSRQSRRTFTGPLELLELSTLLWDVFKIKKIEVDANGIVVWNHRGSPSAGGLASVEVFIVNISGNNESLYHYNPYDHTIEELDVSSESVQSLIDDADELIDTKNATLLIYAAEVTNLFSKYENAESLLWRDAGAVYTLMNLTSESLGLNSCALGATFNPLLPEVLRLEDVYVGVGGQVIGHR